MSDIPDPPHDLVTAIKAGNAIAIVGSGLTCAAGGPDWPTLLTGVAATAAAAHVTEVSKIRSALVAISEGRLMSAADLLKAVLGAEFKRAVVREIKETRSFELNSDFVRSVKTTEDARSLFKSIGANFNPRDLVPTISHRQLMQLNFRAVVTTNYDYLLEDAAPRSRSRARCFQRSYPHLAERIREPDWFLLRLHGDVASPEDIIITRSDYARALFGEPLRETVAGLFRNNQLFWIGYGHNDLTLDLLIDDARIRFGLDGGFALARGGNDELQVRFQNAGITPRFVSAYEDFPRFLRALARDSDGKLVFSIGMAPPAKSRQDAEAVAAQLARDLGDVEVWQASTEQRIDVETDAATLDQLRSKLQAQDGSLLEVLHRHGVAVFDGTAVPSATAAAKRDVSTRPASARRSGRTAPLQAETSASTFELLARGAGGPLATLLFRMYLQEQGATSESFVAVTERTLSDVAVQREARRVFEALADQILERLVWACEAESRDEPVNVEKVAHELGQALLAPLSAKFLKDPKSAARLAAAWRRGETVKGGMSSEAEGIVYDRLLDEAARYVVDVITCFPTPDLAVAGQQIERIGRMRPDIATGLDAVEQIGRSVIKADGSDSFARFEADYRTAIAREEDFLELFGADLTAESRRHKLSVAYMSLSLETGTDDEATDTTLPTLTPAEMVFDGLGPAQGRLLIRGEAGSGKTTLFRWAAIKAAAGIAGRASSSDFALVVAAGTMKSAMLGEIVQLSNPKSSEKLVKLVDHSALVPDRGSKRRRRNEVLHWAGHYRPIAMWRICMPFLIRLRNCPSGRLPDTDSMATWCAPSVGKAPRGWADQWFSAGRALVLIDGIDEVPSDDRSQILSDIRALVKRYPKSYVVVSTRPASVPERWLSELGFREATIAPMSDLDRDQFIDRWHTGVAHELALAAKPTADLPELAQMLKADLKKNPSVARLATNPLLAAMICALNRDRRSRMPESQHELLEALCHMLLHRRERESGLDVSKFSPAYRDLTYPQKKVLVQQLARELMIKELSALPAEEAARILGETLATMRGHASKDARAILDSLVERSGMLREKSPGVVDFVHNTFKEFLTAEAFVQDADAIALAKHAGSPAWEDVLLFAAAGSTQPGFTSTLIREVLGVHAPSRRASRIRARSGAVLRQQFLAVRLRAVSQRLDRKLDAAVSVLEGALKRPTTMRDAAALATLGNASLALLRYRRGLSIREAAANIRALRLIGTPEATAELIEYADETRMSVIIELAQAINPLRISEVVRRIAASEVLGEVLDPFILRQIVDLSPLADLTALTSLDLRGTQVSNLRPLAGLTALTSLFLGLTGVSDLGPLASLTALTFVDLNLTPVSDLSPLASLIALTFVDLNLTPVSDLSPLTGLTALTSLDLSATQVSDLGPLTGLTALTSLDLGGTPVSDLRPLAGLTALTSLSLGGTFVSDLGPLAGLTALTSLSLSGTQVSDLRPLAGLTALTSLDLKGTAVSDLRPLAGLTALTSLDLSMTQVNDLGPLTGLTALERLDLRGTRIREDSVLATLPNLVFLNGSPIPRKR